MVFIATQYLILKHFSYFVATILEMDAHPLEV
jgi:hypothetical protein